MNCFDPRNLVDASLDKKMLNNFKKLITEVCEAKLFNEDFVDYTVKEFTNLQKNVKKDRRFIDFRSNIKGKKDETLTPDRLDVLYHVYFSELKEPSKHLWHLIAMLLILSHGQATVERGFSVNRQVTDVNQSEISLQAKRTIKDHLRYIGGLKNLDIDDGLINLGRTARIKYRQKLEKEKTAREREKQMTSDSRKRKEMASEKEDLCSKKRRLVKDIAWLEKTTEQSIDIALETGSASYMQDAQRKRKEVQAKKEELTSLESKIARVSVKIKNA